MDLQLIAAIDATLARYPAFNVDRDAFRAHVQTCGEPALPHLDELYLAFACVRSDPAAITLLERDYLSRVPSHLRRLESIDVDPDDVRDRLRERVLPPPLGTGGKLGAYTGRGGLHAWLKVATVRLAIDVARRRSATPLAPFEPPRPAIDPLSDLLRIRYAPLISGSLQRALTALGPRERNVLRLHFVEGASLEAVGRVYGKNRSTVFRWLEKILDELMRATLAKLKIEADLSTSAAQSLLRELRSQITLELQTLDRGCSTGSAR